MATPPACPLIGLRLLADVCGEFVPGKLWLPGRVMGNGDDVGTFVAGTYNPAARFVFLHGDHRRCPAPHAGGGQSRRRAIVPDI